MNSEEEIEQLSARYGEPIRVGAVLPSNHSYLADLDDRRTKEVLMVVMRPNGRLLAMTKPLYPMRVFRLPTGGVDGDEPILEALIREVAEETSLEVEITRFLAHIQYRIPGRERPEARPFSRRSHSCSTRPEDSCGRQILMSRWSSKRSKWPIYLHLRRRSKN